MAMSRMVAPLHDRSSPRRDPWVSWRSGSPAPAPPPPRRRPGPGRASRLVGPEPHRLVELVVSAARSAAWSRRASPCSTQTWQVTQAQTPAAVGAAAPPRPRRRRPAAWCRAAPRPPRRPVGRSRASHSPSSASTRVVRAALRANLLDAVAGHGGPHVLVHAPPGEDPGGLVDALDPGLGGQVVVARPWRRAARRTGPRWRPAPTVESSSPSQLEGGGRGGGEDALGLDRHSRMNRAVTSASGVPRSTRSAWPRSRPRRGRRSASPGSTARGRWPARGPPPGGCRRRRPA